MAFNITAKDFTAALKEHATPSALEQMKQPDIEQCAREAVSALGNGGYRGPSR